MITLYLVVFGLAVAFLLLPTAFGFALGWFIRGAIARDERRRLSKGQ